MSQISGLLPDLWPLWFGLEWRSSDGQIILFDLYRRSPGGQTFLFKLDGRSSGGLTIMSDLYRRTPGGQTIPQWRSPGGHILLFDLQLRPTAVQILLFDSSWRRCWCVQFLFRPPKRPVGQWGQIVDLSWMERFPRGHRMLFLRSPEYFRSIK